MNYQQLIKDLSALNQSVLRKTVQSVNFNLTLRNWFVGQYIFEYEQNGKDRAKYGDRLLKNISKDLTQLLHKGVSERNLAKYRMFFRKYPTGQTVSAQSSTILPTLSAKLLSLLETGTSDNFFELKVQSFFHSIKKETITYFMKLCQNLTWSHFVELIRIDDELERQFYEVETLQNKWSVREMKRQIDSLLFARICLSKDKDQVLQVARQGVTLEKPEDLVKDPVVLEFLDLPESNKFSESDLETSIINNLHNFLLEMGKGFCFIARQKRITFNTRHYYIDLLLYNRKLKSIIAVDLKVGEFDHADAGQMNFYLNYLEKEEMEEWENPPIGIILCASKDQAFVEFALGNLDDRVFVSQYQLYLPTKNQLKELVEKTKQNIEVASSPSKILLTDLDLPKRIVTILHGAGITEINDLVPQTESDLLKIRNFGQASLKKVISELGKLGVSLAHSQSKRNTRKRKSASKKRKT